MATLVNFNKKNKLLLIKQAELFIDLASKDWIATANKSIQQRGAFFVALSGGNTPLAIFREIVKNKDKLLDLSKIFLFWGDERTVPITSSESNYGQAMSILAELHLPEEHIFRMQVEEAHGDEMYQQTIETVVPDASFDMVMLGMGEDGHTLSLFPDTEGIHEQERLVMFNDVPQLQARRMTITLPLVHRAKHVVAYVQGENKREVIKNLFSNVQSPSYPIASVGTAHAPLFWILAPDAYRQEDFSAVPSLQKLEII